MSSVNFEKAVLCAALEDPESLIELAPLLEPEDFGERRHRSLWRLLKQMMQEGQRPEGCASPRPSSGGALT